jgi:hypothetical protein
MAISAQAKRHKDLIRLLPTDIAHSKPGMILPEWKAVTVVLLKMFIAWFLPCYAFCETPVEYSKKRKRGGNNQSSSGLWERIA